MFVLVVLLDTRHLMNSFVRKNMKEIDRMTSFIIKQLQQRKEELYDAVVNTIDKSSNENEDNSFESEAEEEYEDETDYLEPE